MVECEFNIWDLESTDHYKIFKQDNIWWIFNVDGEGVEIEPDALFSMVDKYFKENMFSMDSCDGKHCEHKENF